MRSSLLTMLSDREPSYPPSTRYPWLHLHPDDTSLPNFLKIDPSRFTPTLDKHTRVFDRWGTPLDFDDGEGGAALPNHFMRTMQAQSMYFMQDTPEQQYIGWLMKKKVALMETQKPSRAFLFKRDFTLMCELVSCGDGSRGKGLVPLKPVRVWRRIVVSGGMNLTALHDRVLGPAMGWVRNYHGYLFRDPTDGSQFGPENSHSIDMMHMNQNGYCFIPDSTVKLGQLLKTPGDYILYNYDLGDNFEHRITLESIGEEPLSTGAVRLVAGEGACPPEDSIGQPNKGCDGFENLCKLKGQRSYLESCHEALLGALNYKKADSFDPEVFDIDRARKEIKEAISSKSSVATGAKHFHIPLNPDHAGMGGLSHLLGRSKSAPKSTAVPGDPSSLRFTVGTKVMAQMGNDFDSYKSGVIIALWDEGKPYRIRLDNGLGDVFAPEDDNRLVRLAPSGSETRIPGSKPTTQKLATGFFNVSTPQVVGGTMEETIRVGKDPKELRVCLECGSPNDLRVCSRCKIVSYCSIECQKKNWNTGHKQSCCRVSSKA